MEVDVGLVEGSHAGWSGCSLVVVDAAECALAEDGPVGALVRESVLGCGVAPALANMVKQALGHKYHWAVADYLQRSARHIASATDVEQAYAVGQAAVQMALEGKQALMPTIVREQGKPYRWKIGEAPLSEVANQEKKMPIHFITDDGFGITQDCRDYLEPLIAGESFPPFDNGLPRVAKLQNTLTEKKLKTGFEF